MTTQPTDANLTIDALNMVRSIRDAQLAELNGLTPDEIIAFYRRAGEAARRDAEEWAKTHVVPASTVTAA